MSDVLMDVSVEAGDLLGALCKFSAIKSLKRYQLFI